MEVRHLSPVNDAFLSGITFVVVFVCGSYYGSQLFSLAARGMGVVPTEEADPEWSEAQRNGMKGPSEQRATDSPARQGVP